MKRSKSHKCPKSLRCALRAEEEGDLGSGQIEASEGDGGEPEYGNDRSVTERTESGLHENEDYDRNARVFESCHVDILPSSTAAPSTNSASGLSVSLRKSKLSTAATKAQKPAINVPATYGNSKKNFDPPNIELGNLVAGSARMPPVGGSDEMKSHS